MSTYAVISARGGRMDQLASTQARRGETQSRRFAGQALAPCARVGRNLTDFVGIGRPAMIAQGRSLFLEGEPARYIYRIMSGAAQSYRQLADGRRQIIDFLFPGDLFGVCMSQTYSCSTEACADTVVIRYPRHALDGARTDHPDSATALLAVVARQLDDAHRQMMVLGRKTAEERVASFLLEMSERCAKGDHIHLPMVRADIADHLGLSIETVSRVFTKFRADGLVSLRTATDICLVDRPALEELAGGC